MTTPQGNLHSFKRILLFVRVICQFQLLVKKPYQFSVTLLALLSINRKCSTTGIFATLSQHSPKSKFWQTGNMIQWAGLAVSTLQFGITNGKCYPDKIRVRLNENVVYIFIRVTCGLHNECKIVRSFQNKIMEQKRPATRGGTTGGLISNVSKLLLHDSGDSSWVL